MSHPTNTIIEEDKKEIADGNVVQDIKYYLSNYGATEFSERLFESIKQEQSRIIIDKLVDLHGKTWGERLYQ